MSSERWFNKEVIDRFARFAKHCKHPKGQWAGEPFHILPFQQDFIDEVYGWYRGQKRETRSAFFSCARGNGKSSFASLLAAYELFCSEESNPYILIASANLEAAGIIFNDVVEMIYASPVLNAKAHVVESDYYIEYRKPGRKAVLQCIAAERRNAHGKDASACFFDECHLLENRQRDFVEALKYSTAKNRKNPLILYFTTAGITKDGPAWDCYQHAKNIKESKVKDASFKSFIWETTPDQNIDDEATWEAANPAMEYGIVDKVLFRQQLEEAKQNSVTLMEFTYQKLNRWVQTASSYLDPLQFDLCKQPYPCLEDKPIILGFDPSASGVDLAALVGLIEADGVYYSKVWAWTTEEGMRAKDNNLSNYKAWQDDGLLKVHPGNTIDFADIRATIAGIGVKNPIKAIVMERWRETETQMFLAQQYKVWDFPPYASYFHAPTVKLARMIGNRSLAHDGNGLLRFCCLNLEVKTDSKGLMMPFKKDKNTAAKNDAAVALILAIAAIDNPDIQPARKSIYEDRMPMMIG